VSGANDHPVDFNDTYMLAHSDELARERLRYWRPPEPRLLFLGLRGGAALSHFSRGRARHATTRNGTVRDAGRIRWTACRFADAPRSTTRSPSLRRQHPHRTLASRARGDRRASRGHARDHRDRRAEVRHDRFDSANRPHAPRIEWQSDHRDDDRRTGRAEAHEVRDDTCRRVP
jgi:hypothetical protein